MSGDDVAMTSRLRSLVAVCFDYRGVILDHKTDKDILPGMENLLGALQSKGLAIALISRFPVEILMNRLGPIQRFFGSNVFSGGGQGKLDCIREFARKQGINDLAKIAFIDDKPDNILPVAKESEVYVIGFAGSGKYPKAPTICRDHGIVFVQEVKELETLLLGSSVSGVQDDEQ
jgi:hypothetical protein